MSWFLGRRPTCKSLKWLERREFDGGGVFSLSILMLLIKPQTAPRAPALLALLRTRGEDPRVGVRIRVFVKTRVVSRTTPNCNASERRADIY